MKFKSGIFLRSFLPLLIILLLTTVSCKDEKDEKLPLLKLKKTIFEDKLNITGSVEPEKSTVMSSPDEFDATIVYLVENGKQVKEGDVVCILENKDLENSYDQFLIEVENAAARREKSIADMKLSYALLEAQVKSLDAQTQISNLDSLQLKYLSPNQKKIKELELQKAAIEKDRLVKKLKAQQLINNAQMKRLEFEVMSWENRIKDADDWISKLTIKARQSGVASRAESQLNGLEIKEGDQIWSGAPLVRIPDLTKMKVNLLASEAEYKRMQLNDPVELTFDAMPGNKGWGKITKKAPVGKPVARDSKVKVFEMEASVDSSLKIPAQGYTANCKVILKQIKDTIVVPQVAIFDVDSRKMVYVKIKNGFEGRQVLTGETSPNDAVIIKGLKGNETISLMKPATSSIKRNTYLPKAILNKQKIKNSSGKASLKKPEKEKIINK